MALPIPVALLGFSNFERNALASYFRLAPRTASSYIHVTLQFAITFDVGCHGGKKVARLAHLARRRPIR